MPQELRVLKELQALDRERRELFLQRQQLDEEMGGLKGEFNRVAAMATVLDEAIAVRRGERQELAGKIEHERGLAARAETRLPQIKTQREYLAVLKEVDAAKKQIKEIGDLLAAKDSELEALKADREEKGVELEALETQTSAREAEINAALAGLEKTLSAHGQQRDGLLGQIPVALRKRYDMLLDRRNGLAVVEARDATCLGCHMHLPPQFYNRLFVAQEAMTCPHCNRLLYLEK